MNLTAADPAIKIIYKSSETYKIGGLYVKSKWII